MIKPDCFLCDIELKNFGGILFGPPIDDRCNKHHICADCYGYIIQTLGVCKLKKNKGYAKP